MAGRLLRRSSEGPSARGATAWSIASATITSGSGRRRPRHAVTRSDRGNAVPQPCHLFPRCARPRLWQLSQPKLIPSMSSTTRYYHTQSMERFKNNSSLEGISFFSQASAELVQVTVSEPPFRCLWTWMHFQYLGRRTHLQQLSLPARFCLLNL